MSQRDSMRLWAGLLLVATLGAAGVIAWLSMAPVNGPPVGKTAVSDRSSASSPSFEREGSTPQPTALASPSVEQPVVSMPAPAPAATPESKLAMSLRRVAVTVVDKDGRAIAGATVQAFAEPTPPNLERVMELAQAANKDGKADADALRESLRSSLNRQQGNDPSWADPLGAWTTDAAGTAFVDVPSDVVELMAEHEPEGCSGLVKLASTASLKGAEPQPALTLSPRGTLNGRVLTVDGAPAAGAQIVFTSASLPNERAQARLPRPLVADADGRFSVTVDTPFFTQVHAELDAARTVNEYAHASPGEAGEIELRFPGAFSVNGTVLGPDGAPVPRAEIRVTGWQVHADRVRSDEQGHFRLPLTRACHVGLVAKASGFAQTEAIAVTLSESQPSIEVKLRMQTAASISGLLRGADGRPMANAMVSASAARPNLDDPGTPEAQAWFADGQDEHDFEESFRGFANTDARGFFRFDSLHPDSAYDLSAYDRGDSSLQARLAAVPAGTEDADLVFEAVEKGTLQGRVVDASTRSPLSPCKLTCFDWRFSPTAVAPEGRCDVSDADAHFRIEDLATGLEYGLLVEAVNYPPTKFGPYKTGNESLELAVGKHASFDILVTDSNGAPQPGASVQLVEGTPRGFGVIFGNVQARTAGTDGRLVWPTLRPGTYSLEAVRGSLRAPRVKLQLAPGGETSVHLVVAPAAGGGKLEIVARRADGRPWAGATVKAVFLPEDEDAEGDLEAIYLAPTDVNGRLVLDGLAPGVYAGDILNADVLVPVGRAEVTEGGTATMELEPKG